MDKRKKNRGEERGKKENERRGEDGGGSSMGVRESGETQIEFK